MESSLTRPEAVTLKPARVRVLLPALLALGAAMILLYVGVTYRSLPHDAPLFEDSTLNELAVWMSEQAEEDAPPSFLARLAQGTELDTLLNGMQTLVLIVCVLAAGAVGGGIAGMLQGAAWSRRLLLVGLIGLDVLLFLIPVLEGDATAGLILAGVILMLVAMLYAPGRVSKFMGFMIVISSILVVWEGSKALAASINFAVTLPQSEWTYTAYPTLDDALNALNGGAVGAVIADENDLENLMQSYPEGEAIEADYPDLRYLRRLQTDESTLIFPVTPARPGRLSVAVRAEDTGAITRNSDLLSRQIGAVEGDFAVNNFLSVPRQLVLLDLKILNDLNLPHLQTIAEAFLQPARRNGDFLLIRILGQAGLYTWREAVLGFGMGVVFGLLLGTLFAHIRLMERALLPYVVASQTVPILAIAPMVVIWLGASFFSVAVIAAYITFFPVTINTLRGLKSPHPNALELMDSYAANWWTKLWKLRFPAALPYIFAALKVSATASVVGAIIGELPSGIGEGLGRAILDFSSDYSMISTPKLWAAIITAAFVGVIFFVAVSLLERIVLRRYMRSAGG
jgi:NitT/TauT family transport system permease protein